MAKDPEVGIREAKREHCFEIARDLRRDDYLELRYMFGSDVDHGWVLDSQRLANPKHCHTLFINEDLVGIGGCAETRPGIGVPWFIGTSKVNKHRFTFHYLAKKLVEYWSGQYLLLSNVVWDGSKNKAWLERLGFSMSPSLSFITEAGGEFRRFTMIGQQQEEEECVQHQHSLRFKPQVK